MSAAEPVPTSSDYEVLQYCRAIVAADDAKKKQTQSKTGWLGVVGLADLSRDKANFEVDYRTTWIAENINNNNNIGVLKELQNQLEKYTEDYESMKDNKFADEIVRAVDKKIIELTELNKSLNGGRPKTSKKRTTTRRRRSSKRKARKARTTRRR